MGGLESDTIGGYNALLQKQKLEPGEARVTTVLFDDRYELLHDRVDIREVRPIGSGDYYVRGCTALLDAIGRSIAHISRAQELSAPEDRADKVLVVITTDGLENASREYGRERVRRMVERAQEELGWEFLFLGANMDAISAAGEVGIRAERAVTYRPDSAGTRANFDAVCAAASCVRARKPLDEGWKKKIEDYMKIRGTD